MAHKRPAEEAKGSGPQKRPRTAFNIGPRNLPDGVHKRKVDKIRRKLIENAKIRQSYDKLKAREERETDKIDGTGSSNQPASTAFHPERQALIDQPDERQFSDKDDQTTYKPKRRPKQQPHMREQRVAHARAQEIDKRREEAAASRAEREKRLAQRERWRRTMANARGDGKQRKLGKESTVLLEKVKRTMEIEKGSG